MKKRQNFLGLVAKTGRVVVPKPRFFKSVFLIKTNCLKTDFISLFDLLHWWCDNCNSFADFKRKITHVKVIEETFWKLTVFILIHIKKFHD